MGKYRKKPIVVEAEPYRVGLEDGFEYEDNMPNDIDIINLYCHISGVALYPYIVTLEGRHYISKINGKVDWIITGIQNERYPCKADIFEQTYEAVGIKGYHDVEEFYTE